MVAHHWVLATARELFSTHGLGSSWSFGFDRAKTRFGQCDHRHQRITLSRHLCEVSDEDAVEQVLLHEIAHALVGARAGHGERWQKAAHAIGYRGGRTHTTDTSLDHAPWLGRCPRGHEVLRYRKPSRAVSCAQCEKRFNPDFVIAWSRRDLTARP